MGSQTRCRQGSHVCWEGTAGGLHVLGNGRSHEHPTASRVRSSGEGRVPGWQAAPAGSAAGPALERSRDPVSWQARSIASTVSNCTWQKELSFPAGDPGRARQLLPQWKHSRVARKGCAAGNPGLETWQGWLAGTSAAPWTGQDVAVPAQVGGQRAPEHLGAGSRRPAAAHPPGWCVAPHRPPCRTGRRSRRCRLRWPCTARLHWLRCGYE